MSRQANGTYLQPANTAAVSGQTISSTAFNTLITDVGTEITNSLDRAGRSAMQAALPMGSNKITGMADPTLATDGATKNYVDTATGSFFSTGDVKLSLKNAADTGWVLFDDGTFGSAASGSSSRANADTQPLFTLFFNNLADTAAPLLTSGGAATTRAAQTNAATAWAANCRMSLPKTLGRALGVSGAGSGLTPRTLGQSTGAETVVLGTTNLPPYTPSGTISASITSLLMHVRSASTAGSNIVTQVAGGTNSGTDVGQQSIELPGGNVSAAFSGTPQGGSSTAFSIIQPTVFLNAMVKL